MSRSFQLPNPRCPIVTNLKRWGERYLQRNKVVSIAFHNEFNDSLQPLQYFPKLRRVAFDRRLSEADLDALDQCKTLTILSLSTLEGLTRIPKSVTQLELVRKFNEPLEALLHVKGLERITRLRFGDAFNKQLSDQRRSFLVGFVGLRELVFGHAFNQDLEKALVRLEKLDRLVFGDAFNQPLRRSLSTQRTLEHLEFGASFEQPFGDSLRTLVSLDRLVVHSSYNEKLLGVWDKLTDKIVVVMHLPLGVRRRVKYDKRNGAELSVLWGLRTKDPK